MRIRAVIIFGVFYALAMAAGIAVIVAGFRMAGLDASHEKTIQNTGFLLNMAVFAAAIVLALSRRVHARLGGAPGPLAFRQVLLQNRYGLAAGFALLAILVDLAAYMLASSHFTGEMRVPSLPRLAFLTLVYGGLAWMVISDKKGRLHGSR